MHLKTESSSSLQWIIYLFICFLFSCTSDSANNVVNTNSFNIEIQEKLKQVKQLQDSFEFDRAIDILQGICQQSNFPIALDSLKSNVYHKYGLMLFKKENYQQSVLYLDSAIMIRANIKDYRVDQIANSYYSRSLAKIQLEDEKALEDIQQAIEYIEQGGDQKTLTQYYVVMAVALQDRGDLGQAEYYYQKVKTSIDPKDKTVVAAMYYLSRGDYFKLQRKTSEQRQALQKAINIYKRMGEGEFFKRNYFAAAITFGTSYLEEGDWQKGETYCHTASGRVYKGEGVQSLARAFSYAGCPSLVATLWSVSDFSTKEIIVDFYQHLKNGDSKDVALQKAKLNYIKTGQPSQKMPCFWTNLILIGDVDKLDI